MQGFTELRMAPGPLQTTVASHPMGTMLSLAADAIGGRSQGLPPHWRSAVRAALPASGGDVLGPLFHPGSASFPDCLAAHGPLGGGRAEDELGRLAATEPALLVEQLEAEFSGTVPAHWMPAVRAPRQWLHTYVAVFRALWTSFQPIWRMARPLLDREADRVGAAVVRGVLDLLLAQVSPRCRYEDGVLYVSDRQPAVFEQGSRPLVLAPLISGSSASVFSFDLPDVVWIGYPLPGIRQLWTGEGGAPVPDDALRLLLGPVRAAILRSSVPRRRWVPSPRSRVAVPLPRPRTTAPSWTPPAWWYGGGMATRCGYAGRSAATSWWTCCPARRDDRGSDA